MTLTGTASGGAFTSTGVCVWGVPTATDHTRTHVWLPGSVPESTWWRECLRNVPTPSRTAGEGRGGYKEGALGAPAAQISPYYTQTQRPTLPAYHHHYITPYPTFLLS